MDWYENEYIPRVGKRGAEIIEARGASSAAVGRQRGDRPRARLGARRRRPALDGGPLTARTASRRDCVVASRSACSGGDYEIVEGLEVGDFAQAKIDATVAELKEERDAVKELGLV